MMRTLWSGVTGLQAHQTRMDVIGNNIANVNTVGFKKSEVVFEDLISQTLEIAHGPTATRGGTNGMGVGLGTQVAAISQVHTQGQMQTTGKNTDLALSGNGLFVLAGSNAADLHYTRNGSFHLDANGTMVAANGFKVQGWMSEVDPASGKIVVNSSTSPIEDLQVEVGKTIPANATTTVTLSGNLNSENKLAIDPITVEYTKDDIDRDIKISFEHAHPTLPFYTWKATWATNPPTGFQVGDAVIDDATGYQAQGILELDDSGRVVGSYRNTDGVVNRDGVTLDLTYLNSTVPVEASTNTGSGQLKQVRTLQNANPENGSGYYRITFDNAADPTEYKIEYSVDGNWTIASGIEGRGNTNADYVFGDTDGDGQLTLGEQDLTLGLPSGPDGMIMIRAADWVNAQDIKLNDRFTFQTEISDGNGVLQLPSEKPRQTGISATETQNRWGEFIARKPEAPVNKTNTGTLAMVEVTDAMAAAPTRPVAGQNPTYTEWKAAFLTATTYVLVYSQDGGTTWQYENGNALDAGTSVDYPVVNAVPAIPGWATMADDIGLGPVYNITDDILSFNGELRIQAENWTVAPAANDVFEFKVSPTYSSEYNRGFFTINDTKTELDLTAAGFVNGIDNTGVAGAGTLDTVTIGSSALQGTFVIDFLDADTFRLTDPTGRVLGTYDTTDNVSAEGIVLSQSSWTAGFALGDQIRIATHGVDNPVDITLPDGRPGSEAITFTPNTNDTTMNQADAGNPVTATLNTLNDYQYATSVNVYDSLGKAHTLRIYFERKSTNEWMWSVEDPAPHDPNDVKIAGYGLLAFNADGTYDSGRSRVFASEVGLSVPEDKDGPVTYEGIYFDPAEWGGAPPTENGANAVQIAPDFSSLVQYSAQNDGEVFSQDGYGKGTLTSFTVNGFGFITGLFDNGQTLDIGQIAVASFNNPSGLMQEGDSMYRVTGNSGLPHIGVAGVAGRGTMTGGALEMSNVDLSEEFTNMIVTQRGFQASSRSITTADQMLQELLALKR